MFQALIPRPILIITTTSDGPRLLWRQVLLGSAGQVHQSRSLPAQRVYLRSPELEHYSYAYNNPLQFVDRNGRWPRKIHNQIIDAAFPNLTPAQSQILKDVSAHQDAFLTGHTIMGGQAAALSFQHAIRAPRQSVAEAQQEYEDFVSMNEDQATRTQIYFWAAGNSGLSNDALAYFAAALRAILDSTSPAHSGFQFWEWWHFMRHGKAGATITRRQLNTAVTAARNAFDQTFHPSFPNFNEFDLLQLMLRPPQQTEVKSKICYYTDDGKKVCQ